MKKIILYILSLFIFNVISVNAAEQASVDFSIQIGEFLQIQTITNAVLIANITDRTGNLYYPLSTKFRVASNTEQPKTLYLRANAITKNGVEESMFEYGGRVYIAFANVAKSPTSQSLANCKNGTKASESPGVVAYPINSIIGTEHKYIHGKGKYEVYINKGITNITVNVGSNVLRNSFASNDPKGFYQATLLLTESEI